MLIRLEPRPNYSYGGSSNIYPWSVKPWLGEKRSKSSSWIPMVEQGRIVSGPAAWPSRVSTHLTPRIHIALFSACSHYSLLEPPLINSPQLGIHPTPASCIHLQCRIEHSCCSWPNSWFFKGKVCSLLRFGHILPFFSLQHSREILYASHPCIPPTGGGSIRSA